MPIPQIPNRVDPGWRPSGRELADADLIADWQVFARACGPYLIQGTVAGRPFLAGLHAMDAVVGWALIADRLLVLGERAAGVCIAVASDEVMRRAAEPADERNAIRSETAALAERARRAGMPTLAFLLDLAPLDETIARFSKQDRPDGKA